MRKKGGQVETKSKKIDTFVPHLENRFTGSFCGAIGTPTKFKDVVKRPLCVGDTVDVYRKQERKLPPFKVRR